MMKAKLPAVFGLFILSCLFGSKLSAQKTDSTKLTVANIVTIHSKILNQDRALYIYTPAISGANNRHAVEPMPVLYLMDGEAHTAFVAAEVDYLSNVYSVLPPMIIVGIGNYAYDRMHDLTPTPSMLNPNGTVNQAFKSSGGGEAFLQFVKEEVMPYVEATYKPAPYKVFSGHSLGGLMAFYCLATHPDMFDAYTAVSPSLWWDNARELNNAIKTLGSASLKNKTLFFSDGSEGGRFHECVARLDSFLKSKNISGLSYQYIPYPNETHGSEPVKAEYDALKFIFPQMAPSPKDSTVALLKSFYQKLTDRYRYKILPPENLVNQQAYFLLDQSNKIEEALAFFKLNVENYPASANSYDSLGDAYAKKGDKAKAIECYKQALKIDPGFAETKKKLTELQDKR